MVSGGSFHQTALHAPYIGTTADKFHAVASRVRESAERATEGAARLAARTDVDAREAAHSGASSTAEAELLRMKVGPRHVPTPWRMRLTSVLGHSSPSLGSSGTLKYRAMFSAVVPFSVHLYRGTGLLARCRSCSGTWKLPLSQVHSLAAHKGR